MLSLVRFKLSLTSRILYYVMTIVSMDTYSASPSSTPTSPPPPTPSYAHIHLRQH